MKIGLKESFLQINYSKGYKYIDKAGELINAFYDEDKKKSSFSVNIDGLILKHVDPIKEMRVNVNNCWFHIENPASFEFILDNCIPKIKKILEVLEIKTIQRIGWRIYIAKDFVNNKKREVFFSKRSLNNALHFEGGIFSFSGDGYKYNLRIDKALKYDSEDDPSIIFDIDMYIDGENNASNIRDTLQRMKDRFKDEVFPTINNLLDPKE